MDFQVTIADLLQALGRLKISQVAVILLAGLATWWFLDNVLAYIWIHLHLFYWLGNLVALGGILIQVFAVAAGFWVAYFVFSRYMARLDTNTGID